MKERKLKPCPPWMTIDTRPMDEGEWQQFGYGYSGDVNAELWRPANRVIIRRDGGKFKNFDVIELYPDALLVSNHGRVYSRLSGRIINNRRYHKRHNYISCLTADGKHRVKIRRYKLVIANWIEPPANIRNLVYYQLDTVNHRDHHAWNDRLDNLQYCSRPMNAEHEHKFKKEKGN